MIRPTLSDFNNSLTPEYLRSSQIIHGAMAMGVLSFLTVVILMYSQSTPSMDADDSFVQVLSIVHAFFGVAAYGAAFLLYKKLLTSQLGGSDSMDFLNRLRSAQIIRLTLFEGVAFFGLTVCMVASLDGVLHVEPVYWWNVLSAGMVVGLVVLTFPTAERIVGIFSETFTS